MTAANAERVVADLNQTRMSLFTTMQKLNRFYRKDDKLVRRAQSFYDLFADFTKECEQELKAKLSNK